MSHIPTPPLPNGQPTWTDWLRLGSWAVGIAGWTSFMIWTRLERRHYYGPRDVSEKRIETLDVPGDHHSDVALAVLGSLAMVFLLGWWFAP